MTDCRISLPSTLDANVRATVARWRQARLVSRIWQADASVWTGADEAQWLGWLRIVDDQHRQVESLERLAREIRGEGFTRVLLLGMGGSSLASEVLGQACGHRPGFPRLQVLDSTDPSQVRGAADEGLERTLIVVASKSGSTLEPNILLSYFLARLRACAGPGQDVGRRVIAMTDPGSQLEEVARQERFRTILHGVPSIGGRFSALSDFGMAPAALAGIDVRDLLRRATAMATRCRVEEPLAENPGVLLGTVLGEAARAGRDKPTLVMSPDIGALGAWLEQLLAESTGKNGKGIVPIDGEPIGSPDRYGNDRVFVHLRVTGDSRAESRERAAAIDALDRAGQPVIRIELSDPLDLGAEFFRWEIATAVAGAILQVNPFDQPDVESAKHATRTLAAAYESHGALPDDLPVFQHDEMTLFADPRNLRELESAALMAWAAPVAPVALVEAGLQTRPSSVSAWLRAHFARVAPGDYVALLAYLPRVASIEAALRRIREAIRDRTREATSVGFGPRYLHSTGQVHKGGPNTGVFLAITADPAEDVPVPGQRYTFGIIERAQALGDVQVLAARGRRVLRVHLGPNAARGLGILEQAVTEALASPIPS